MRKENILDVIEAALSMAGYVILDVDSNAIIIRDKENDQDYDIQISEAP